jgi:hypothetical protein
MSPSYRDRGPDPDDPEPEKPDWVDDFFRQLRKERASAQGSLISYNESNEHIARSMIGWAAGIVAALLIAGICGGLALSNQFAAAQAKAEERQLTTQHQIEELKTEIRDLRQTIEQRH